MVSVVIPLAHSILDGHIFPILDSLVHFSTLEIIVIHNLDREQQGSLISYFDKSSQEVERATIKVEQLVTNSRAARINRGIDLASHNLILIHHPRSIVEKGGIEYLIEHQSDLQWGGFTHRFDHHHLLLDFTSWYSNRVRAKRGIIYLDHSIFAPTSWLKQVGPLPPVDIFEDTILSAKLRVIASPIILPYYSTTSAIRFLQRGVIRQIATNLLLKVAFHLKISSRRINMIYEQKVKLNSKD